MKAFLKRDDLSSNRHPALRFCIVARPDGKPVPTFHGRALGCAALALVMAFTPNPAGARGCIKGAIVGGVAGHYAGHHGLLGAAAGCIMGRHMAKKHEQATQNRSPNPSH